MLGSRPPAASGRHGLSQTINAGALSPACRVHRSGAHCRNRPCASSGSRPARGTGRAAAVQVLAFDDGPEPATASSSSSASRPINGAGALKIIGLGQRGISAVRRLKGGASPPEADFWAIDSDRKVLATTCPDAQQLQVPAVDDASLSADELMRISAGGGSSGSSFSSPSAAAAAARQQDAASLPPAPQHLDCDSGVAFILASAWGSPGGAPMMLQLATHLRRQGYFVVVALTCPFAFEGPRKIESAEALVEAMEDVAHLTVVVRQDVLMRASGDMTMADACAIADNSLVCAVQSVLCAVQAPEVLIANRSGGPFVWHGRDLRAYARLLSPPLQRLLTCPGPAALGRGQVAVPLASLRQAGLASALSTMAEDSVAAAADSPFLEAALPSATAVLCLVSVPSGAELGWQQGSALPAAAATAALNDPDKYALRSAIQVAAMTVHELAGPKCGDVIVCPVARADAGAAASPSSGGGDVVSVEVTLLVLQDPEKEDGAVAGRRQSNASAASSGGGGVKQGVFGAVVGGRPPAGTSSGAGAAAAAAAAARNKAVPASPGAAAALRAMGGASLPSSSPAPPSPSQSAAAAAAAAAAPPQPSAKSEWRSAAMSALAGGSAAALSPGSMQRRAGEPPIRIRESSNAGSSGRTVPQPAAAAAKAAAPPPPPPASFTPRTTAASRAVASTPPPPPPQQIPRMADNLIESLVSQSLDLPPSAAKWRAAQKKKPDAAAAAPARKTFYSLLPLAQQSDAAASDAPGDVLGDSDAVLETSVGSRDAQPAAGFVVRLLGLGGGKDDEDRGMDVRARVAGVLERDRADSWGEP